MTNNSLLKKFGAHYFSSKETQEFSAPDSHLYFFQAYMGPQEIIIERGDCAYTIFPSEHRVTLSRGPLNLHSPALTVIIRGYMPESKSSSTMNKTVLPYVNGCSTKQIFPPDRLGDPTLQMLHMPAFTTEQQHHIHSTTRVVYVSSGRGVSVVGIGEHVVKTELRPGTICILEPMCPHHFETGEEELVVLPLHIWSSVGPSEKNHPMFNGTHIL